MINGGLSATDWQNLELVLGAGGATLDGYPQFIAGDGLINGDALGNDTYFLSLVVPEPASLSILALAPLALLIRRRTPIAKTAF